MLSLPLLLSSALASLAFRVALKARGVKNPSMLLGNLKRGEVVELPDGSRLLVCACADVLVCL